MRNRCNNFWIRENNSKIEVLIQIITREYLTVQIQDHNRIYHHQYRINKMVFVIIDKVLNNKINNNKIYLHHKFIMHHLGAHNNQEYHFLQLILNNYINVFFYHYQL
jgi:hypothetical protein